MFGIFTTDAKLAIGAWDEWLARITGVAPERARGQSLATLFPDLETRGMLAPFRRVLAQGIVEVLAPALHHYLFRCPPDGPSKHFDAMQQRITIAPLREDAGIAGTIVTVEDVTARLDREKDLAGQLVNPDPGVRLKAAESLAEEERLESTQPLVGALGDQSWRVRRQAVEGLARHGSQDLVKSILRALREEHWNLGVLNSALQVLAVSGVDAVAPLIECLSDADADLRIYAAHALGDQLDPRAVPALMSALTDADPNVRYHAIEALGKLRAADAVEALIGIAKSGDFHLAFPAIDALTKIGDSRAAASLVPLLADELLRVPAADALGQLGDEETVAPLVELLNQPDAPALVISEALATLYDRGEKLFQEGSYVADQVRQTIAPAGLRNLLEALDNAGAESLRGLALVMGWIESEAIEQAMAGLLARATARKEVVEALVRYGKRVTDLLIAQLDSEDPETRHAAVVVLGRIGDPRALPALLRLLERDDESVIAAAGALSKIGDRGAFEALLGLIGHPGPAVRQAAIAAINSIGHPETEARAVKLLADPDPRVRESAVKIAGYFGFSECVELLIERTRDADENVRRAAIEHLPYVEHDRALDILTDAIAGGTPRVRAAAAQALAHVEGRRVLSCLMTALNDSDDWTRYYAARSLGRRGFPETVDELARLAHHDPASQVRIAALEALARIGGDRAVATLAPLAESADPDIARSAIAGLGLIGHPAALPPLLAVLRAADPERRMEAVRALGERGGPEALEPIQWAAAVDGSPQGTEAAIEALARLARADGPTGLKAIDALAALASDPARREGCIGALAQLGKGKIDLIGRRLDSEDPGIRCTMVEALGRMKHARASEYLITALDDNDATVRLAAVNALVRLGSRSAERKLAGMARTDSDPTVRRAAHKVSTR